MIARRVTGYTATGERIWERVGDRKWQSPAHQTAEKREDRKTGKEYYVAVAGLRGPSWTR